MENTTEEKPKNKAAQALAKLRKPENMTRGNSDYYKALAAKSLASPNRKRIQPTVTVIP